VNHFNIKKAVQNELLFCWQTLTLPVPMEAPLWLRCQANRGRQNHAKQISSVAKVALEKERSPVTMNDKS